MNNKLKTNDFQYLKLEFQGFVYLIQPLILNTEVKTIMRNKFNY